MQQAAEEVLIVAVIDVRKKQVCIERLWHEGGPRRDEPIRRGSVSAVVINPFAGRYVEDLMDFMDSLTPLAKEMAAELLHSMGVAAADIEGYGKGAIVGANGEMEHAAIWHTPGGAGVRSVINNPKAIVPSSKKVGHIGAQLDIPVFYIHACYVRSHYDAIAVVVPDGPRPNEVVYSLVMSSGPRVHARIGGLSVEDIVGEDGQR